MNVYEAINSRRTVRDFDGKPIPPDIIRRIVEAGLKAPTNDHMRSWEFVIVNDPSVRKRLIAAVNEPASASGVNRILDSWGMTDKTQRDMYLDAIPKQYKMLYTAGCLILPFFKAGEDFYRPRNISGLNSFASIWCCIENMLITAASEGIFGVTRIPLDGEAEHIRSVVNYPEGYIMPCYMALGYPAEDAVIVEQKVTSARDKIHFDKW